MVRSRHVNIRSNHEIAKVNPRSRLHHLGSRLNLPPQTAILHLHGAFRNLKRHHPLRALPLPCNLDYLAVYGGEGVPGTVHVAPLLQAPDKRYPGLNDYRKDNNTNQHVDDGRNPNRAPLAKHSQSLVEDYRNHVHEPALVKNRLPANDDLVRRHALHRLDRAVSGTHAAVNKAPVRHVANAKRVMAGRLDTITAKPALPLPVA